MNIIKFNHLVKVFCIIVILYIYLFILSDLSRLNPNDDGDFAFIGMLLGFLPTISIIAHILLDEIIKNQRVKNIIISVPMILAGLFFLAMAVSGYRDGYIPLRQVAFFFGPLLYIGTLFIPLFLYILYTKTKDRFSFVLIALGLCIIGLSMYPAKNYIQAKLSGEPCATMPLIIKGASEFQAKVHGDVVCIAKDRGYPSQTYEWAVLQDADAKTFEQLDDDYSRDKRHVFYNGQVLKGADAKTFEIVPKWRFDVVAEPVAGVTQYKKDSQNIYFQGEIVPVKNINSFQINEFCESYRCATDGILLFRDGKVVEGVDMKTLHLFRSCGYSVDKNHAYYNGEVIKEVDAATFNLYYDSHDKYCYAHDKKSLYYKGEVVSGASAAKLEKVAPGDPFSLEKSGQNTYYDGKKLDLDIKTFQYLGKGVSKDATSVYQGADKIEGADPATFEIIPNSVSQSLNVCAKDKNHRYFNGEIYDHPSCIETF